MLTTLLGILGFVLISVGFWLAWAPLGFIVGGVLLALTSWLVDGGPSS